MQTIPGDRGQTNSSLDLQLFGQESMLSGQVVQLADGAGLASQFAPQLPGNDRIGNRILKESYVQLVPVLA